MIPSRLERCSSMSSVTLANLQCFVTFPDFKPICIFLAALIAKRESPSTIFAPVPRRISIWIPCSKAVNSISLLVPSPIAWLKMCWMSPLQFRKTPPIPVGRGLPWEALSKFSLWKPMGGCSQAFMEVPCCCRGSDEMEMVPASIRNDWRICKSDAKRSLLYSTFHLAKAISLLFFNMVALISSSVLASFWNTLLFHSFHTDHTMNSGISFHNVFTVSDLEKLLRQFSILSCIESLFLSVLLKMVSIQFQRLFVQLQIFRRWFIGSSSIPHRGQREGPMNPLFQRFPQVRVLQCIKSHRKVLIFGHSSTSHTLLYKLTFSSLSHYLIQTLASLREKVPPLSLPQRSWSASWEFLIFLLDSSICSAIILLSLFSCCIVSLKIHCFHAWLVILGFQ